MALLERIEHVEKLSFFQHSPIRRQTALLPFEIRWSSVRSHRTIAAMFATRPLSARHTAVKRYQMWLHQDRTENPVPERVFLSRTSQEITWYRVMCTPASVLTHAVSDRISNRIHQSTMFSLLLSRRSDDCYQCHLRFLQRCLLTTRCCDSSLSKQRWWSTSSNNEYHFLLQFISSKHHLQRATESRCCQSKWLRW